MASYSRTGNLVDDPWLMTLKFNNMYELKHPRAAVRGNHGDNTSILLSRTLARNTLVCCSASEV